MAVKKFSRDTSCGMERQVHPRRLTDQSFRKMIIEKASATEHALSLNKREKNRQYRLEADLIVGRNLFCMLFGLYGIINFHYTANK
ncbi:hypothetical protein CEXT_372681 [Caerostris extrusa]|uniref:Uncharacterized protein n=1 Tax=Caerostris extrusa TaxID=172846 RepID=A0AAV4TS49_CAEEX|nr:hypothetical protein CEXT_372681 [Caerostris extrusa]